MDIMLAKIIELIGAKHGSAQELVRAIGCPKNAVTDWKAGRSRSYKEYAPQIAAFYGVSLDWLSGLTDQKEIKKAPPAGGASGKDDLVRLSEDAQDRLYKIFSAALEANNITGGFAVSRTGVDGTILTRMQNKRLSMANRSELMQLARFLEVQAEAEPLIQGLPALEETLADIYRQLHDQIYQIDPDDIGTVSEVLQVWIKSRKKQ